MLDALVEICPVVRPTAKEMRLATELVGQRRLTIYDAAYAAVAESPGPRSQRSTPIFWTLGWVSDQAS